MNQLINVLVYLSFISKGLINNFAEYGLYFFSVPISFLIIRLFSKSMIGPYKLIPILLIGISIPILLNRELESSNWFEKIVSVFFGSIITLLFYRLRKRNQAA